MVFLTFLLRRMGYGNVFSAASAIDEEDLQTWVIIIHDESSRLHLSKATCTLARIPILSLPGGCTLVQLHYGVVKEVDGLAEFCNS